MAEGPIGRSLKRVEDPRLLRGQGRFVDDLAAPLHVAFVRSPVASGRLRSIDAAASRVTVFTAADIEGSCLPLAVHLTTPGAVSPARPILAIDRVRFVGEMIAAVVAENRYAAADAVELVQPEIDPLPAVVGFEDAMSGGAPLVHEVVTGNLYFTGRRMKAEEAKAAGLVNHLVPAGQAKPRATEIAMTIARNGPIAVRQAKKAIAYGSETDLETAMILAIEVWVSIGRACAWSRRTSGEDLAARRRSTPRRSCWHGSRGAWMRP